LEPEYSFHGKTDPSGEPPSLSVSVPDDSLLPDFDSLTVYGLLSRGECLVSLRIVSSLNPSLSSVFGVVEGYPNPLPNW